DRRPVSALRHHRLHRAVRFVQRNRAACLLALLLLASVVAGSGLLLHESARRQQALERSEAVERFLLGLFRSAQLSTEEAAQRPVSELLATGAERAGAGLEHNPLLAARLLQVIATAQDQLDQFDAAPASYVRAHQAAELAGDQALAAEVVAAWAGLELRSGRPVEGLREGGRQAVAPLREERTGSRALAMALGVRARFEEDCTVAAAHLREAIGMMDATAPDATATVAMASELAALNELNGQPALAVSIGEDAFARATRALGPEHLETARTGFNLAKAMRRNGDWERAYALMQRTTPRLDRLLPPQHTDQIAWRIEMATAAATLDELADADRLLDEALQLAARPDLPPM